MSRNTAPRRNTCLGFNWISRKRWVNVEETFSTSNGANLRKDKTSSYPPFTSTSSAVRAVRCFVTLINLHRSVLRAETSITEYLGLNINNRPTVGQLVLFRFSTCRCVPEIFAIKVKSCQKLRRTLDIFTLPNSVGGTPCKISVHVITRLWAKSPGKISWGYAHYQSYRCAYVEF